MARSVREKVGRHKAKWLASGAAGAFLAVESASCVCDPLPSPINCALPDGGTHVPQRYAIVYADWHFLDGGPVRILVTADLLYENLRFTGTPPMLVGGTLASTPDFAQDEFRNIMFLIAPGADLAASRMICIGFRSGVTPAIRDRP